MPNVGGKGMWELVKAGGIGVVTAAVGLVFALSPFGASLDERFGLTWLFSVRGPVEAPGDVLVVGLDRRSTTDCIGNVLARF